MRFWTTFNFVLALATGYAHAAIDLKSGLVGQWKMDGNLLDSSTNGNHGSNVNAAGFRTGLPGMAASMTNDNGVQRYVNLGRPAGITNLSNQFTIAFWVFYARTNGGTRSALVTRMNSTTSRSVWNMDITESTNGTTQNFLRFAIYTNTLNSAAGASSTASFPSNTWTHVACVWDGTHAVVYTNGATNFFFTNVNAMNQTPFTDVLAGQRGDGSYVLNGGALDEISIYNRPLNLSEVQALRTGLSVSVTNPTNGTTLFSGAQFQGFQGSSLATTFETVLVVSNGAGAEVVRQTAVPDASGNWAVTLPPLVSAASYSAVAFTTNTDGLFTSTAPFAFTWYSSSNVRLTVSSRSSSGVPWAGGRVYGPSSLAPFDGLRTNDAAGAVVYQGLWSGRPIAFTNFTPERWGGSTLLTNLVAPDTDATLSWIFDGGTNSSSGVATPATNPGYWSGQSSTPFAFPLDLGGKSGARVTIHAVPLSGGIRALIFDQIVTGTGVVSLEIPSAKIKANMYPGIWVLEAKISALGEDDFSALKRRSLLFYYQ